MQPRERPPLVITVEGLSDMNYRFNIDEWLRRFPLEERVLSMLVHRQHTILGWLRIARRAWISAMRFCVAAIAR